MSSLVPRLAAAFPGSLVPALGSRVASCSSRAFGTLPVDDKFVDEAEKEAAVAAAEVAKEENENPKVEAENAKEGSERMVVEGSPEGEELRSKGQVRPPTTPESVEDAAVAAKETAEKTGHEDPTVEAVNAAEGADTMIVEGSPDTLDDSELPRKP